MRKRVLFLLLIVVPLAWSQNGSSGAPTTQVREDYLRAYNAHNTDAVLALYAEDAVLLSEAGVFRGRSEIRKWLQFAIDQGSVLEAINLAREKQSGTLAYAAGDTRRLVGKEVHLGRYLLVMELQNGQWRIIEHASFNVHE